MTSLLKSLALEMETLGFLGDPVVESPPWNAGDTGSILDLGRLHMLQSN